MPRREASIDVNASPDELWRFIRDFESLCTCIPGVERIDLVDHRTAVLTVKEKVGVVPMVLALRATIEREDPPRSLHAIATAEHLTMAIDVELQGIGQKTALHTVFDVTGAGPLKPIVDNLFERRATERTAQFTESLGKRFGAGVPTSTLAQPQPTAPTKGVLGRLFSWLRSLLSRRSN
ncbi:MAG: SRPBCC domain-containing protein [Rhizobacter sp.]|nr:SRPBCC domain-containing protein [Rhizobacter sp.]